MDVSLKMKRSKKSGSYYISACIFVLLVLGIASSLYYSALKIDYVWRWYRIPQYFVYQDQAEIRAQMEGEIESILIKNKKAVIRIESDGETESHTVPASGIRVDKGDLIFPGDTLATY
jgi:polar amino acid transport system permease protein